MHKVRYSMSRRKVTILYLVTGPSVFHIRGDVKHRLMLFKGSFHIYNYFKGTNVR